MKTAMLTIVSLVSGCVGSAEGLRKTPPGNGPEVVVDWDARPLPEIPFPNDLATRTDPTSMTGLRLNISTVAITKNEAAAREKLNELMGFGVFAPISVSFGAPLDLDNIVDRHPSDLHRKDRFDNDAFYLIDVDPASPDYLKPVDLDVGHGRYPVDMEDGGRLFANDPRANDPSALFESTDEDINGNGKLDPGEDTDNDGVLDKPNVYPLGGDPRADQLTFYERETDTLIVRPVVPLREMGRYAVVLTERLIGEDGKPVRSPWTYVNHLRQTAALVPVLDALPQWGLSVDDVAYAWVFSTGRQSGDLVDLHRALFDGEGPYRLLQAGYPAGVLEAPQLHTLDGFSPHLLPVDRFIPALTGFGALGAPETEALVEAAYLQFGGAMVGGAFTTPYLLGDAHPGGSGDTDEWWQLDPVSGQVFARPQRIPFTCMLPKESDTVKAPFPVAIYGHGHGSTRLEMLLFAWSANRMGVAMCGIDYPGHGLVLPADIRGLVVGLLDSQGVGPALAHLEDGRARDLTNDGVFDSGADQWISDPFHSRDMVRQGVLDWMQFVRVLQGCGTGEMVLRGADGEISGHAMRCDWDGDGAPDIGGPDLELTLLGGSLGGINAAVAAAVIPEALAVGSIVPGGGLMDVGIRSDLGGVTSAVMGRMLTPLILGVPSDDGSTLQLVQLVNQYMEMAELSIATIPNTVGGGRILLENLDNGEVRQGGIPADGRLRITVPADAPTAIEKRALVGMPDTGPGLEIYTVPDNAGLGDRLVITVYDAAGNEVAYIDSWAEATVHEGITYEAGSPLVAGSHGMGHIRGTPDLRRLVMATSVALEPGDPIVYAPHWFDAPFPELGGRPANVLVQPGIGDLGVSIGAGIALARAGGLIEMHEVDARYGMTVDQWLIDRGVLLGFENEGPYVDGAGNPALFDPDDLDLGTDGSGAPSETPLRVNRVTKSGVSGLRLSYPITTGMHGFPNPDPSRPFDTAIFVASEVAWWTASGGQDLRDDVCLGADTCPDIPRLTP